MTETTFTLPVTFDLFALFFFGLTGAMVAIRRNYDIVGICALAVVCGAGGGVIRDGIFLQGGPPAIALDPRYFYALGLAVCVGLLVGDRIERFGRTVALLDALGLGAYAVFGTQKALAAGLNPTVSVFIGLINACGGGLLRDIIMREEPLVFKPGQFYVLAALFGALGFVFLIHILEVPPTLAGVIGIVITFLTRYLGIRYNWKTRSFYVLKVPPTPPDPVGGGSGI